MKTKPVFFSRNNYNRIFILFCCTALMLGGTIYILFRATEPVFFHWIRVLVPGHWLNAVRHISISSGLHFPSWIVFSLPNGLWAFSYALLITAIWWGRRSWIKTFWMASIPLLVLGFECLQYVRIIPGTFCLQDIALGMAGMISGITLVHFTPKS